MTHPAMYRGREKNPVKPEGDQAWLKKTTLIILIGGMVGGAVAFFMPKKSLALGFFLGSVLSILYFYSLHALSLKILRAGGRGGKIFWIWTIFRWALAALVCWGLVLISPSCLLGSLGGYLWALGVLVWSGWRAASRKPLSGS